MRTARDRAEDAMWRARSLLSVRTIRQAAICIGGFALILGCASSNTSARYWRAEDVDQLQVGVSTPSDAERVLGTSRAASVSGGQLRLCWTYVEGKHARDLGGKQIVLVFDDGKLAAPPTTTYIGSWLEPPR